MLSKSCDPLELTFDPMIESVIAAFRAELALVDTVREVLAHAPVHAPLPVPVENEVEEEAEILDGTRIIANCLGRMFRV